MNKADTHPSGDQFRLRVHRGLQQPFGAIRIWVVARDGVLTQLLQLVDLLTCREDLKRADTNMRRRDPRDNRTGQHRLAVDLLAGSNGR